MAARQKTEKDAPLWKTMSIVGMILVLIGAVVAVYFVYGGYALGSGMVGLYRHPYNESINVSGFNQAVNSVSARYARFGVLARPIGVYAEGVVIGLLMVVIGILTFKYSKLKAGITAKGR